HAALVVFVEERLDLADVAVDELLHVTLPAEDLPTGLDHAARAERVGLPRIAQGWSGALGRPGQGTGGPSRDGPRALRQPRVDGLEGPPGQVPDVLQRKAESFHETPS